MLRSGQLDPANWARGLEIIERNASVQVKLVEDILDVSRIISGKLRLEVRSVDLHEVVRSVHGTLGPAAAAKRIRLLLALDPDARHLQADADRLQQVVWNLGSNAVKFTPQGGQVEIRVQRCGGFAELVVYDTGQGIAPEFLPFVFERFRQADGSTTRRHGGLGLGLALVRHLVELHGGTVSAASDGVGRGAHFTVRLPIRCADGAALAALARPSGARLEGACVLIVDDDEDALELLSAALEGYGAKVIAVRCADAALGELERLRPDVLLSDIAMPGQDGFDLIRRVRLLPPERGGATPAAALTGRARDKDRQQALDSGFQLHVPKPVEPEELARIVAELARQTRASAPPPR